MSIFKKVPRIIYYSSYTLYRFNHYSIQCRKVLSCTRTGLLKHTIRKETFETKQFRSNETFSHDKNKLFIISQELLEDAIAFYRSKRGSLDFATSIKLLEACNSSLENSSPESRKILAVRVWKLLIEKQCDITVDHYNTFLKVSLDNYQAIDHNKFLHRMTVDPDIHTYYFLLCNAEQCGNFESMCDIANEIKEKFGQIDEVYTVLLKACSKQEKITEAIDIYKFMLKKRFNIPNEVYFWLAYGCIKTNNLSNFNRLLEERKLIVYDSQALIDTVNAWDNKSEVPNIMPLIVYENEKNTNVIVKLIRENQITTACELVESVLSKLQNTDEIDFIINRVMDELKTFELPLDQIFMIIDKFSKLDDFQYMLTELARVALEDRKDIVLSIFEKMKHSNVIIRPHYYWPLFVEAREEGENMIYSLIENMTFLNVKPDYATLIHYVLPHVNMREPLMVVRKLQKHGVENILAYSCVISHCLTLQELDQVLTMCQKHTVKIDFSIIMTPLVKEYKRTRRMYSCMYILQRHALEGYSPKREFLIGLLKDEDLQTGITNFVKFLRLYKYNNETLSSSDINALMKVINFQLNEDIKKSIYELYDNVTQVDKIYNTRQLEMSVIRHEQRNTNIRGTLRQLFLNYCRKNEQHKAFEIKDKFDSHGFEWTTGMKMSLIELYIKANMLDDAVNLLLETVHTNPNFKVDSYKIIELAIRLVRCGKFENIFSILESCPSVLHSPNASRNCYQLLCTVAEIHGFDQTKKVLQILVEKGYCQINNKILGGLIKAQLLQKDITAAVKLFEKCVYKYKCTPLKMELLLSLAEQMEDVYAPNETGLFQEVCQLITKVHGHQDMIHNVITAVAKSKKLNCLRTLLQNEKVITADIIQKIAFFSPEDKADILTTIIKENKFFYILDSDLLFETLLNIYDEKGDIDSIKNLYDIMEEAEVPLSKKCMRRYIQSLMFNKIPIPPKINLQKNEMYLQ